MGFLKNELFPSSDKLTVESGVSEDISDENQVVNEVDGNLIPEPLETNDNIVNAISVDSTIESIQTIYSDNVNELDKVKETSIIIEDLNVVINKADDEISNGELSQETANEVIVLHNKLMANQGIESKITLESAIKFKSESYEITRESAIKIIKKVKEALVEIIKRVTEELKKAVIKIIGIIDNVEIKAKEFANVVSSQYSDIPVEKYKDKLDPANVMGRIAICENFDLTSIKKFIDFTNRGAPIKDLVEVYGNCIKIGDMHDLEALNGIKSVYDLKTKYFSDNEVGNVIPIRVSGKDAIVLVSEKKVSPSKGTTYKVSKKVISIIPSSNLKTAGLLPRKDIIGAANYLNTVAKEQRKSISESLNHLDSMRNATNSIKDDSKIGDRVTTLTSILTSCIFDNAYSGIISNRLLLGLLADQAQLYTKQKITKK